MSGQFIWPKEFSGTSREDITDWIRRFEKISTANRWDSEEKLLKCPAFLSGAAMEWHDSVVERVKEWAQLKDLLMKQFIQTDLRRRYMSEINKIKQGMEESTADYTLRFNNLANKIDINVMDKVEKYIDGLLPLI